MTHNPTDITGETLEGLRLKYTTLLAKYNRMEKNKKLGLVWEKNPDAQLSRLFREIPMLSEDVTKAIITDESAPSHILINGDNSHALTALRASHMGKVDVIYIDPPYNTGNKDFIYNDSYIDKEDGYRHSKWLSFMENRLKLAKELLSDTGVIFVSIDDNEHAHLKLLMDEVFGANNFLSNIIWEKTSSTRNDAKYFSNSHEYVLTYHKGGWIRNLLPRTEKVNLAYKFNDGDGRGPYAAGDLSVRTFNDKNNYEVVNPQTNKAFTPPTGRAWGISEEKMLELIADNKVFWGADGKSGPKSKRYLSETQQGLVPGTLFKWDDVGSNIDGDKTLKSMFGDRVFDYPKPTRLIQRLVSLHTNKSAVVLDFFAGSGTTAHAVAELNKTDGGNRQCIVITDGGKTEEVGESAKNAKKDSINIAEDVTYERLRRALTGKEWSDGKTHEALGGNLRYYKVEMHHINVLTEEGSYKTTSTEDQHNRFARHTRSHIALAEGTFLEVASKDKVNEETFEFEKYVVLTNSDKSKYVVAVEDHDYSLQELKKLLGSIDETVEIVIAGHGVQEIEWIAENRTRYRIEFPIHKNIESHKFVTKSLI